jgi:putrescine aminotransferase
LAGGMFPIAAVLLTRRVNRFLDRHPLIHLSTFGGSDVGCRVAAEALALYREERPWENAVRMGERLGVGLRELAARYPTICSVRGAGLAWSLELASTEAAIALRGEAAAHGVLASTGRVCASSLVFRPSLLITDAEVDAVLAGLAAALETSMGPRVEAG